MPDPNNPMVPPEPLRQEPVQPTTVAAGVTMRGDTKEERSQRDAKEKVIQERILRDTDKILTYEELLEDLKEYDLNYTDVMSAAHYIRMADIPEGYKLYRRSSLNIIYQWCLSKEPNIEPINEFGWELAFIVDMPLEEYREGLRHSEKYQPVIPYTDPVERQLVDQIFVGKINEEYTRVAGQSKVKPSAVPPQHKERKANG